MVALRKVEMSEERLYSIDEAAAWLGFHRNTIKKWIASGELVATRPGRRFRIRQSDLDDFLRRKQITPKQNKSQ